MCVFPAFSGGQPHIQPHGGQVNGGFVMAPTVPAYIKDNNSAPPPSYNTVVNSPGYQTNQHVQYPVQNDSIPVTSNYTSLSPQTNSSEHYYSTISESQTPSAPSAENI